MRTSALDGMVGGSRGAVGGSGGAVDGFGSGVGGFGGAVGGSGGAVDGFRGTALPPDWPGAPGGAGDAHLDLDAGVVEGLTRVASECGTAVFTTLFAAFAATLRHWTRGEEIAVGTTGAALPHPVLVRTLAADELSFRELVRRVAVAVADALAEGVRVAPWIEFGLGAPRAYAGEGIRVLVAGGGRISLAYDTARYRHATAAGFLTTYRRVLEQAAKDPGIRVAELSLAEEEAAAVRKARLVARGGPFDLTAYSTTVDRAFRERAGADPGSIAVRHGAVRLDYAALDRWSEAIAHRLRGHGVGHGEPVAVCLARGTAAVAGVLGVLKAGGYVVSGDADADARFALTDGVAEPPAGLAAVPAGSTAPVREVPALELVAEPADLAYVLGAGVMIEHRSLAHACRAASASYGVAGADRVLHVASMTTYEGVLEVLGTLLAGGEVVVAGEAERRGPELLARLVRDAGVTVAYLPPALMEVLEPAEGLRLVVAGGAPLSGASVTRWTAGGRRVVNGYGADETTGAATVMRCTGGYPAAAPIGRAAPGHLVFVLDEWLRPVPPGVPGELCVAGPGVARGYLGRPDLTFERFVHNPYADGPATGRLFRTGVVVRRLPTGNLELVGDGGGAGRAAVEARAAVQPPIGWRADLPPTTRPQATVPHRQPVGIDAAVTEFLGCPSAAGLAALVLRVQQEPDAGWDRLREVCEELARGAGL